jgi:hypothetical protein
VFEAQGWELPVELSDGEDEILALNETRGVGRRDRIGLREFSGNRYPNLWKPVEDYFPGGLVNSDGDEVTDLIEECCARDVHGTALHARWVEAPDREHECFYMDRNNPVWREYLKAVIRIQIDAGVDGVQLDETELPIGSFQYGGCFCKDCIKGFRAYLRALPVPPRELDGVDLDTFHYGRWLLARGYDFKERQLATPLYRDYYRFQCDAIRRHFHELAEYAREYARSVGRAVRVSGNFFNMDPQYLALVDDVDVIVTEMRNTTYRQPEWYRYVAGFAGDKDVIVVENPYGGVVPDLVEMLGRGRGYDLFRLSLYEAAAFGANMAVPYGSWMGATIQDSFTAPHGLAVEVQAFLADHAHLYRRRSRNEVAVVYGVESNHDLVAQADVGSNLENARDAAVVVPYRRVVARLARAGVPFDVVLFPDPATAPDRVEPSILDGYRTVVVPAGTRTTARQAAALDAFAAGGGHVARGAAGDDLAPLLPDGPQCVVDGDVAVNTVALPDGATAVHLVNYDYAPHEDRVRPVEHARLRVRLPAVPTRAIAYRPGGAGPQPLDLGVSGGYHEVVLDALGPYTAVVFS